MKNVIEPQEGEDLYALAKRCNALYICPKDDRGTRKGPLVIYAGQDELGRNFVGDIYFNFRRVEEHPRAVEAFAEIAWKKLLTQGLGNSFDTVCGIPQGGRTFGQALARIANKRFVYADKKPKQTEEGKKQEYVWDLTQFEFEPGERVALAEDVFNNFQNTDKTLEQIAERGVTIVLLVGALNRSSVYDTVYTPKRDPFLGVEFPVVASIREAFPEYRQDDGEVLGDIRNRNLETDVKRNWRTLLSLM